MRTTVFVVFAALVVIACRSPRDPQPPVPSVPLTAAQVREVRIEIDAKLSERLALGLPMRVELRAPDMAVGECTIAFDLWEERYKVALSKTDLVYAADPKAALQNCIEPSKLRSIALPLIVREMPHLHQPRADYPVF